MDQLVRDARGRGILLAKGALFSPREGRHSAAAIQRGPQRRTRTWHRFLSETLAPALR